MPPYEFSEGAAKYFDKIMAAGYRDYTPFIEFMKKVLKPEDVVLELDSGTGNVIEQLKEACHLEALEHSPKMAAAIKQKDPEVKVHTEGIANIKEEDKYTIIFSHSGPFSLKEKEEKLFFETYLESEEEILDYFKNVHRLLQNNGRLVINIEVSRPERHLVLHDTAEYFSTTIEEGHKILRTHVVMGENGEVLAKQTFTKTVIPYDDLKESIEKLGFTIDLEMVSVVAFKKV